MNRIIKVKPAVIFILSIAMSVAGSAHFPVIGNTGNNMTLLVRKEIKPECNGEPLHDGDEIGVFTSGGLCVGASLWNGSNTAITVWGDNTVTEAVDGAQGGEKLTLRIWCSSRMKDCTAKAESSSGGILYRTDGISILSSLSTGGNSKEYDNTKDWNVLRHACDNLNKKVEKSTGGKEKEFLKYTTGKTGWCKINPKYL